MVHTVFLIIKLTVHTLTPNDGCESFLDSFSSRCYGQLWGCPSDRGGCVWESLPGQGQRGTWRQTLCGQADQPQKSRWCWRVFILMLPSCWINEVCLLLRCQRRKGKRPRKRWHCCRRWNTQISSPLSRHFRVCVCAHAPLHIYNSFFFYLVNTVYCLFVKRRAACI